MIMWNIPDDNIIFLLRNINCHNRIQSILKSHEKKTFSKIQALGAGAYQKRIDKLGQVIW